MHHWQKLSFVSFASSKCKQIIMDHCMLFYHHALDRCATSDPLHSKHHRVRQIVCPVIPGTPKSVIGPLDILPGCSVGTLDLATSKGIGGISHLQCSLKINQSRYNVAMMSGLVWQLYISGSPSHALLMICQSRPIGDQIGFWESTIYAFWSE